MNQLLEFYLEMSSIEVLTLCHPYDVISHPLYRKCVTVYTHHSAHPSPQGVHPPPHAPSVTSSPSVLPSWPPNTRLHDHEHDNNPQAGSGEWEELPYAHLSDQKINLWKTLHRIVTRNEKQTFLHKLKWSFDIERILKM